MLSSLKRHPITTVFVVALVTRVVAAVAIDHYVTDKGRDFLIEGDANGYWELAGSVAEGKPYVIGGRTALRMPGFPVLLAGVRLIAGDSLLAARVVIAVIGAAGCAAVFLLGRALVDVRAGWIAGLWTAVSPTLVGFTPLILTESVFATALTLSLLLIYRTHEAINTRERILRSAIAAGVLIAVATYIRPTWILTAPFAATCLTTWHRSKAGLQAGAAICVATFLMLLPWGLRNVQASGHFVLTTLWVGPSLYDGLHPGATGESDMQFVETDGLYVELGEFEANRHYRDEALAFARRNPRRAMELATVKLGRFWNPLPNAEQFASTVPRIACAAGFFPLMLLAVVGAWKCRRPCVLLLCLCPILYFSMLHAVFVGSLRYRLPAEYPLSVLAAVGVLGTAKEGSLRM